MIRLTKEIRGRIEKRVLRHRLHDEALALRRRFGELAGAIYDDVIDPDERAAAACRTAGCRGAASSWSGSATASPR